MIAVLYLLVLEGNVMIKRRIRLLIRGFIPLVLVASLAVISLNSSINLARRLLAVIIEPAKRPGAEHITAAGAAKFNPGRSPRPV